MTQARPHLEAATAIVGLDPPGAYQLTYDGARKALVAVLENQGLRPTHIGGHIVVYEAVRAQLDPPHGNLIRPFNRMRRARNQSEYPSLDQPALVPTDVANALTRAGPMLDLLYTLNREHLLAGPIVEAAAARDTLLDQIQTQLAAWPTPPVHVSLFARWPGRPRAPNRTSTSSWYVPTTSVPTTNGPPS